MSAEARKRNHAGMTPTHGEFFLVQLEACADRVFPAAEMPLPEAVAEDGDVVLPGLIFTLQESPSQEWLNAEE